MSRDIIALIGSKGCGKTTLGNLLVERKFRRQPFAEPIKVMLSALLRFQNVGPSVRSRMLEGDLKEVPSIFFSGQTPRRAMQTLGSEWRDLLDKNLWVDIWEDRISQEDLENANIVVDDMRFLHEHQRVKTMGGTIVLIKREGTKTDSHISEQEYVKIPYDLLIHNDWEPQSMLDQLTHLLDKEF